MSRRLAHRPRYRSMGQPIPASLNARQAFFHSRWTYRRQTPIYEKHALGYALSRIPLHYRHMSQLIVHQTAWL